MKYLFVVIIFLVYSCSGNPGSEERISGAVNEAGKGTPKLVFEESEHDFGRVVAGEQVVWYFQYRNEGDAPLMIKKASASCGCTVPEFDRQPLAPGEKSTLKVVYNSTGRSGLESKTVTIESNAENNIVRLKLKAEVINN